MEKRFLAECLAQGMSLPEIGRQVGRAPGTIGYWVAKHGLEANGKRRFSPGRRPPREQLEVLLDEGLTLAQVGARFGVGPNTVRNWIIGLNLKGTRGMRRIALIRAAREAGLKEVRLECTRHGETEFWVGKQKVLCRKCNSAAVARRRRRVKEILVEEAGGCCRICGFSRSSVALEFHHLDPAEKSFAISLAGVTRSLESIRVEAAKCMLLCANCHAEVEAGLVEVPLG
jgi:transposase-like protein